MAFYYQHAQPSTLFRAIAGVLIVFCPMLAIGLYFDGYDLTRLLLGLGVFIVVPMIILALFHALTVRVSANWIEMSFGIGLIRKRIAIMDIESSSDVTNRWYYGRGIRKIQSGWMFNVSGFDAVEIRCGNGRRFRIGTDEPRKLLKAIESATAAKA
jgi:hypothetical protein